MTRRFFKRILDYLLFLGTFAPKQLKDYSLVLCYHCLKGGDDPNVFVDESYCINPKLFEQQMIMLSRFFDFVPLEEIIEPRGRVPSRKKGKISITFDDGYKSVKDTGLPILEKYGIPVTIFIATKFAEEPHFLPWWDLLAYVERNYTGILEIDVLGKHYVFDFDDLKQRNVFSEKFSILLRDATPYEREKIQSSLEREMMKKIKLPLNGIVSLEDVREMSRLSFVTIGAHTHSHVNVARCTTDELRSELKINKVKLLEWTGKEIEWLAFPFGKWHHVGSNAAGVAKELGFKAAFMTEPGYVGDPVDMFRVPRLAVDPDWSMLRFRTRIFHLNILGKFRKGIEKNASSLDFAAEKDQ